MARLGKATPGRRQAPRQLHVDLEHVCDGGQVRRVHEELRQPHHVLRHGVALGGDPARTRGYLR